MNQIPMTQTVIYSINQYCRQEADTAQLAKLLAQGLSQFLQQDPQKHLNISLEGDLGAGKTTFARCLIRSMGYVGKVKSPTYTLCELYPLVVNGKEKNATAIAHHFDLYRMRDPLEWQETGLAEYFDVPGFCLIEWPEKAEGTLPAFDIQIQLTAGKEESERNITLNALSKLGAAVLKQPHD
jgi:tRNA threonylcarbamoyladenosine biosynthesis protein TsaE